MAADSIAKLAVIITGDASPLARETVRAEQTVRRFAGQSDTASTSTLRFSTAISAARGNLAAMGNLAIGGGPVAALAIAAATAGRLAFSLAAVSDAQRVAAGAPTLSTWAGQWDRVQKSAGSIAATLGRPIADVLADETRQIASIMEAIASRIMPEQIRAEQAKLAIMERQNDVLKRQQSLKEKIVGLTHGESEMYAKLEQQKIAVLAKGTFQGGDKYKLEKADAQAARDIMAQQKAILAAKDRREADASASDEANRHFDEMQQRARSIAESFRTPREEMLAAFAEMDALFAAGAMNAEQYDRAVLGTIEKLDKANRKALSPRGATPGIAAAERFTSAGVSAMNSGQRELQRLEQLEKQQLAEDRKAFMQRQEMIEVLKSKQPLVLKKGDLN